MSFDYEKMNTAADEALHELEELEKTHTVDLKDIAAWYKKWYLKAGYKRLTRGLIALANRLY